MCRIYDPEPDRTYRANGKTEALESIGAVSGMFLYNSYVAIGALADGFEDDVYDAETIKSLMEEQQSVMTNMTESFNKLLNSGFVTDASDKEYLEDAKEICALLKTMAGNLSDYSGDKSTGHSDTFQATRKQTWSKISALLGLEE